MFANFFFSRNPWRFYSHNSDLFFEFTEYLLLVIVILVKDKSKRVA